MSPQYAVATAPTPDIVGAPKTLAGAVPPSATLPSPLRKIFDPSALQTLESLWQQIETQTLAPLFMAEPREGLAQTFRVVYPRFFRYYIAATLTLLASMKEPQLVGQLVSFSFDALSNELKKRGPKLLGREPATAALIGVHSMARVMKAAARQFVQNEPEQLESIAAQFTSTTTAYMLTMFAVSHALSLGDAFKGRPENVSILARWGQDYAAKVYDLAVRSGLLKPPQRPPGDLSGRSPEEDLGLAEAGIEEYARLLHTPSDADRPKTR